MKIIKFIVKICKDLFQEGTLFLEYFGEFFHTFLITFELKAFIGLLVIQLKVTNIWMTDVIVEK